MIRILYRGVNKTSLDSICVSIDYSHDIDIVKQSLRLPFRPTSTFVYMLNGTFVYIASIKPTSTFVYSPNGTFVYVASIRPTGTFVYSPNGTFVYVASI